MAKAKNQSAKAANELKKQLTTRFPNVKFSVTSKTYSGGSSVDVLWHFGPTVSEVQALSGLREYGKFNGMEDIYEYTGAGLTVDKDGHVEEMSSAKYVLESRVCQYYNTDKKLREDLVLIYAQIASIHGWERCDNYGHIDYTPGGVWEGIENSASNVYYRIVNECTFSSDNIELLECKWCDYSYNGKRWYEPYTIIYKDLNTGKIYDAKAGEIGAAGSEEPQLNKHEIFILNYSEKSFVVYGNTFPIKDTLSSLKGTFNRNLKHPETGEKLKGWVFSLKRKDAVIEAINKLQ